MDPKLTQFFRQHKYKRCCEHVLVFLSFFLPRTRTCYYEAEKKKVRIYRSINHGGVDSGSSASNEHRTALLTQIRFTRSSPRHGWLLRYSFKAFSVITLNFKSFTHICSNGKMGISLLVC